MSLAIDRNALAQAAGPSHQDLSPEEAFSFWTTSWRRGMAAGEVQTSFRNQS